MRETLTALGMMSGTSADGIDVAILTTDGADVVASGPALSVAYEADLRACIKAAMKQAQGLRYGDPLPDSLTTLEREIKDVQADAIENLLRAAKIEPAAVDVIGFHGQTVVHRPARTLASQASGARGFTVQLGDGDRLTRRTGINVVNDFRSADIAAGGEGAPLAPLYHVALVRRLGLNEPTAVLNIGGVANVSWVSATSAEPVIAFDTGPGNGLIDDWVEQRAGARLDQDGTLAARGRVSEDIVRQLLAHPYFTAPAPKSLDRYDFSTAALAQLSLEDGAATLTAFTAAAVAASVRQVPTAPTRWVVCGGGRHNPTLMKELARWLGVPVVAAESVEWRGEYIEAEAFAYLAVRALKELPLSLPTTTGVPRPLTGGTLHRVSRLT